MILKDLKNEIDYMPDYSTIKIKIYPENGVDDIHTCDLLSCELHKPKVSHSTSTIILTGIEKAPAADQRRRTLKDVLTETDEERKIDDDALISVGALSNFIWQGKKRDALDELEILSHEIDISNRKHLDAEYKSFLYFMKNAKPDVSTNILAQECSTYNKAYRTYRDFVPLLDRKVLQIYPKTIDEGFAIIIAGKERGNIWMANDEQTADIYHYRKRTPYD